MADISEISNPFDFANPVSKQVIFAGRAKELQDISYYLDYAVKSERPINIALLGGRASGKTSLLNMIELMAIDKKLLTVRIDLDEADGDSELTFFFKLIDNLLFSACRSGAFGGANGRTYDTYLDMVYTFCVSEDKTFAPLLFPIQYAKYKSTGRSSGQVSDTSIKHDLQVIYSEVGHGIVLIFDEANVLAHSRVQLQKLRNIFLNMPGYMLVVAGTPELFPVIDDVFSPIIRQFKKVNVGTFVEQKDTEECVKKRIESVGLNPAEILRNPEKTYSEIHELSGGRPYEIQLICHIMFRQVQERRARNMGINFAVLEEVRRELEISQDMSARPLLSKVRNLDVVQLRAMSCLMPCDVPEDFENCWSLEFLLNGTRRWTRESLSLQLSYLCSEGILASEGGILRFCGDDFDKIYTRYFAREKRIGLGFLHLPFDTLATVKIGEYIAALTKLKALIPLSSRLSQDDLLSIASRFTDSVPKCDPFLDDPSVAIEVYFAMVRYRGASDLPVLKLAFELPWLRTTFWYYAEKPEDSHLVSECISRIDVLRARVEELGGSFALQLQELPVATIENLAESVSRSANESAMRQIIDRHMLGMIHAYSKTRDRNEALFLGELVQKYRPDLDAEALNNLGYLYLSLGRLDDSVSMLEKSIAVYGVEDSVVLPHYNLAIAKAMQNRLEESLVHLRISSGIWSQRLPSQILCLQSLVLTDGSLNIMEITDPVPNELVKSAIQLLERLTLETSQSI